MPADRNDLARRLAAATAADTSRGLNYTTLFGLVREQLGADAALQVDVLGKGHRVDFFSYPVAEYLGCTWNALDRLEARLGGVDAVLAELGRRTIAGFFASAIGRTVFAISGKEPRRIVAGGPAGYRSAVSYGDRSVEWDGPTRGRMIFKRDFMPPVFHQHVILAALEVCQAPNPRVVGRATGFLDSVYEIEWDRA
jgi:uncharacterized protein (TIGR02265 family)